MGLGLALEGDVHCVVLEVYMHMHMCMCMCMCM